MTMQRYWFLGWCLVVLGAACGEADHRLGADPNANGSDAGASGESQTSNSGGSAPTGGKAQTGGAPGSAGEDGETGGAQASGGNTGAPIDDLSGIWDVVGTARAGTTTFVVSLSDSSIVVNAQEFLFNVLANADGFDVGYSYQPNSRYGEQSTLVITPSEEIPFGFGAFPIDLGGSWSIRALNAPNGCSFQLTDETAVMGCGDAKGPSFMTDVRRSSLVGNRVSRADSRFGNLGGDWDFVGPVGTSCSLSVDGNQIEGLCNSRQGQHSFAAVFEGDDASGTGTHGFEFSAHRR